MVDEARREAGNDDVRLTRILGVRSLYALIGLDIRQGVSDAREALAGADPRLIAAMIAKVGHLVSILDGPDILFPTGKSTLGRERIREAVEAVRAAREKGEG